METLEKHPEISADLIDLRTLQPLDYDTIQKSVQKTNKVIVLQEDTLFGGIASDLSAWVMEHCFEYLDAPVKRIGRDRKSTRLNSSHVRISYAVFCLKKKTCQ